MVNTIKNIIICFLLKNTYLYSKTCRVFVNQLSKNELELYIKQENEREVK